MGLLGWISIGFGVGFAFATLINGAGPGFWAYILIGTVTGILGGAAAHIFGLIGVQGVNWFNLLASLIVSIVLTSLFHSRRKYRLRNPLPGAIETRFEVL